MSTHGPEPHVDISHAMASMWGKSGAGEAPLPLCQHLFDTAATAGHIWDNLLSPAARQVWDDATAGTGRDFFRALCALHDIGKATPAFQSKQEQLAAKVMATGLSMPPLGHLDRKWYHSLAGAKLLRDVLGQGSWPRENISTVWPFIAGHHGTIPSAGQLEPPGGGRRCHAPTAAWTATQTALIEHVLADLGLSLDALRLLSSPTRAHQLALLGWLIVADWMASSETHFPGTDGSTFSAATATCRADVAWVDFALGRGWAPDRLARDTDQAWSRFGQPPRPSQTSVLALAGSMPAPGLLMVEAPMGEGKTEAALGAVEVLARRFGADGVFVGMPTQATADPMFSRVRAWAETVDPQVPVVLLHGRSRFNPAWRALLAKRPTFPEVDQYGCDDAYGATTGCRADGQAPSEWLLGRKRQLLAPVVVATVDQLLYAATRSRHVMLRYAGLIGKVVVLDEVHAYDIYMSQFLHEALRWLAEGGVPVVILSATLPPAMRAELARAYLQGALTRADITADDLPPAPGYPAVTSVCAVDDRPRYCVQGTSSWRPSVDVTVDTLPEPVDGGTDGLVELLRQRLREGGSALVIRNTVGRAQQAYAALADALPGRTVLLHSRLTAGERADRTADVLRALGPDVIDRPEPFIVVATQLAEQSFDIDADLLITDLAPIDLLLQRIGRLHRHAKAPERRPGPVRLPTVVVSGFAVGPDGPTFPQGCAYVYGEHLLTRAAALVSEPGAASVWSIPAAVPALVSRGYAEEFPLPGPWRIQAELNKQAWEAQQTERAARAAHFLLAGPDNLGLPTLEGLHVMSVAEAKDDDQLTAQVRDGDPSLEVILVRRDERGYTLMDGRPLGPQGDAVHDPIVMEQVLRDTVRLPPRPDLTAAAAGLGPLPGWRQDPWLNRTRALVLDATGAATLGRWTVRYDPKLGLVTRWGDER